MDALTSLQKLGFSETESKVYLTLLKLKEASAVSLSKESELHRRTIYDNLNILLRKGLVSQVEKNSIHLYVATDPKNLQIFLEEKKHILENIMPQLNKEFKEKNENPLISVFIGIQGAKSIIEDALTSKKDACWVGGGYFFGDTLKFSKKFIEQKFKKMNLKIIQAETNKTNEIKKFVKKENLRILPKEFVSKTGYLIYGNKTAIGIIGKNEITTILIENEDCAKTFKNYFDMLWKLGK